MRKHFTGTKKCGGTNACAGWAFVEPEPPEWAVSSYRMLYAVCPFANNTY